MPRITSALFYHMPRITSALFHHMPRITSALFYHMPRITSALFYYMPRITSALFYHMPRITSALFYHMPITGPLTSPFWTIFPLLLLDFYAFFGEISQEKNNDSISFAVTWKFFLRSLSIAIALSSLVSASCWGVNILIYYMTRMALKASSLQNHRWKSRISAVSISARGTENAVRPY